MKRGLVGFQQSNNHKIKKKFVGKKYIYIYSQQLTTCLSANVILYRENLFILRWHVMTNSISIVNYLNFNQNDKRQTRAHNTVVKKKRNEKNYFRVIEID